MDLSIKTTAFSIGRKLGKRPITSSIFCIVEQALPLERVGRSQHCVAFHHPRPSWDPHILVVPTTPFATISTPTVPAQRQFALVWEMMQLAAHVSHDLNPNSGLTMTINGGVRQEIGQVHGHLTTRMPDDDRGISFVLGNPDIDNEPWNTLLDTWISIAAIPGSGYSLMMEIRGEENTTAWLTQSTHDPA